MKFSRYNLQLNFAEIKLPRAPSRSDSHVRFPLSAIILTVNGNGDGEIRTLDPLLARQVLSQLSYTPTDAVPSSIVSLYLLFLLDGLALAFANGLEWTRTTDLTLIRRAL